jgi:mercuric ion transport protein
LNDQPISQKLDVGRFAALSSIIGALVSSSCCVLPLLLVTFGASGAWIGKLNVLDPYKGYTAAITLIFLGAGYWQVFRKRQIDCESGSACATPQSQAITKAALVFATLLVLAAMTIDWWAPFFY